MFLTFGIYCKSLNKTQLSVFTNLHEDSRSQVFVSVPPVAGTAGTTASTEDALVESILLVKEQVFLLWEYFSTATQENPGQVRWPALLNGLQWQERVYHFISNIKELVITSFCLSSTDWKYCAFPS